MSDTSGRRTPGRQLQPEPRATSRRQPASGPSGTARSGRREADRTRPARPVSPLERYRTPILAIVVVALVVGVGLFVFQAAVTPVYACSSVDTVQPAASGELGQVQLDQGNQHVALGDRITYAVCPPASGHHVNQPPTNGPIAVKVYGPNDVAVPNGWVHNLEHGGLVLLYSCTRGACDDALTTQLDAFSAGFPASPVCGIPAGSVGPVVAPFEQMPTRFAALVWDHALYLDTLDTQKIDDFFLRYGEKVAEDGTWIAPPEPQCTAPKPSPSASAAVASPAPSASGG